MLCSLETRDDVGIVRIGADIYLDNHEEFDRFLEAEVSTRFSKVVLDLAQVKAICSAGIGAIVKAHKRAREGGGEVVVINVQKKVQALLEITRLTAVLKLLENAEAAIRHLEGV